MLIHQGLNALNGIEQSADGCIIVEGVDEICYVFAHIHLGVPLFVCQFGTAVDEVGGKDAVKYAFLCGLVKLIKALGKQTEGCKAEYAVSALFLELTANVDHRFAGGDHIVYYNGILTV